MWLAFKPVNTFLLRLFSAPYDWGWKCGLPIGQLAWLRIRNYPVLVDRSALNLNQTETATVPLISNSLKSVSDVDARSRGYECFSSWTGFIASEAKWASASARSKLYLTNGYLEKTCISETKHFGHMVLGTKSVCFDPISRYMEWTDPTRPGPTVTLLRGL